MVKKILFILQIVFLAPVFLLAQNCTINGVITDSESGQTVVGANILVVGTANGSSSDLDGKYLIKNVKPGLYRLRVTNIGYTTKIITDVVAIANKTLTIDINLKQETIKGEEVVITAERQLATESALLAQRKKAATIGDGISMEQVKRTPDATSSDVLKRITGVTIVENKFVFVRGVTDRYNATTLNGSSVTSTNVDADRGSFAFDMIPSNLIENINVTKTATPDLPGDFTGGLVQLTTLDFPEKSLYKLSISGSYNTLTSMKEIGMSNGGGKTDWLGFDDGSRKFPDGDRARPDLGNVLPNTWAHRTSKAAFNQSYNLTMGDMAGGDGLQFGYIGSLSYSNSYQRNELGFDYAKTSFLAHGYKDVHTVMAGGLLDVSVKIGSMHKFSVKNNYNQTGDEKVSFIAVDHDENESQRDTYVTQWNERSSYLGQVVGDHSFPEIGGLDIAWRGSYNRSNASDPDMRTITYTRGVGAPVTYNALSTALRSWATIKERTKNGGIDFSLPISTAKVKMGGLADEKFREYVINFFQVESANRLKPNPLVVLPPDKIFAPENFGKDKFKMTQLSSPRDEYDGKFILFAAYGMVDAPFSLFSENFRFVGGVRMENNEQLVNTIDPATTATPITVRTKIIDYLPSLNFAYIINDVTNLRFAYSNSVDRPEFRELANFYFYDFTVYEGKFGNPYLARALTRNYDVRFELFPNIGELIAVSYFSKSISNAIEEKILAGSNPERTWYNAPTGKNFGWEFELRKSFDFLGGYFKNLSITGNYTAISSQIDYTVGSKVFLYTDTTGGRKYDVYGDTYETKKREMQGQSPYSFNVSFLFQEPTIGTSITLLYNEFGRKLDAVADSREDDVYEEKRSVFDVTVTQSFSGNINMKLAAKDLFPKDREFRTREGNPYRRTFTGTSFSVQLSLAL